jgi:putative transposase
VPHRAQAPHDREHPLHLALRARAGLRSLRTPRVFGVIREALRASSSAAFRVLHYSVQADHVHLIVEAQSGAALSAGARGVSIRIARAINRELGRAGPVWSERYHARALTTPSDVRSALVYVLMNWKKHGLRERWPDPPGRKIDPCSSAPWFDGFRVALAPPAEPAATWRPRTWLGGAGWRRRGLIGLDEIPARPGERPLDDTP